MNPTEWRRTRPIFRVLLSFVALFAAMKIAAFAFSFYARAQREAVAEAVIRDYLRQTPDAKIVFVSIENADPSRAFLNGFSSDAVPVRAASQGTLLPNPVRDSWSVRYRDPKTGRDGVLLYYGVVKTMRGWGVRNRDGGVII